jgi:predicted acetyltransferase
MAAEVRPIVEEELSIFTQVLLAAFGETTDDDVLQAQRRNLKAVNRLGAFEDGTLVGTAGSFQSDLTLPGLTTLPAAAVTYVGVLPTHRRRGILRRLMSHQLSEFRERGEPVAVLTSSEGAIYGRFGYGPATFSTSYKISHDGRQLRRDPESDPVRLLSPTEAVDAVAAIYESYRGGQTGELRRNAEWWELHLRPTKASKNERRFVAVHTGPEGDDAYSIYQVEPHWDGAIPRHRLTVESLVSLSPAAQAAMVSYLFGLDLVDSVTFQNRPLDDDLRWLLVDSRQLETRFTADWLWVRPIDVPRVMTERRYRTEGQLGIEVHDARCPWNTGRWWVEGGEDGASCTAAGPGRETALTMGPAELGSILLGGVTCTTLARAGLIGESRPGSAAKADTFLGTNEAPYCSTAF